jgi:uncharacterized protein YicC (UPF0701 family)
MAENVSNDLIYEILKQIQTDIADLKKIGARQNEQFSGIRHMLVAMQSDDLRQEAALAALRVDVDTIKRRLNLVEA